MTDSVGIEGYTASGTDWFVYSYESNGRVVYVKEYVGAGSVVNMTISYPESMSNMGDSIVETIELTLEPGDILVAH